MRVRKLAEKSALSAGQIDTLTLRLQKKPARPCSAPSPTVSMRWPIAAAKPGWPPSAWNWPARQSSDTRSSIHEMATALTEQSQSVQSIARDMQVIAGQSETSPWCATVLAPLASWRRWPWNCARRWGNSKPPDDTDKKITPRASIARGVFLDASELHREAVYGVVQLAGQIAHRRGWPAPP